jgi:hypothetical protein
VKLCEYMSGDGLSKPGTPSHFPGPIEPKLMQMRPNRTQWLFAACFICCGLSATAQSPAPTNPSTEVAENTSAPTGVTNAENVFYIRSQGLIADSTFIAASLNSGGSAMSEQLALLLLQARDRSTQITLAGGNEPKTLRVIKDAFDSAGSVDLTLLNLTFIGTPKAASRVEKLVKAVHGTFHTRPKLDP